MPRNSNGIYQTEEQRFQAACRAEAARLDQLRKQKEKLQEKTDANN